MSFLLISDFNIQNLASFLKNEADVSIAPFGNVMQVLMDPEVECWHSNPENLIIWTQPSIIRSFSDFQNGKPVKNLEQELNIYTDAILTQSNKVKNIFIPLWDIPSYNRGLGMLDAKSGLYALLLKMNQYLIRRLSDQSNIHLLNTSRWTSVPNAFNPKLWYMAKIPFSNDVFKTAANDIKAALKGIHGKSKKLLILDLDNTLWGGIVGDDGWENLKLGGHDPIGEAFQDFQRAVKALKSRGVILAIVSKNEESVALNAIKSNPEMILKIEDFAAWKINWTDKAQNITELVSELNLGLQSVVFIDDNPVERDRVRQAIPEVFVPDWPEDQMYYTQTLLGLDCFDKPSLSKEDADRTAMYQAERHREQLKSSVTSVDDWLKSLDMKITIQSLQSENQQRTCQLLNKTNQMNLTTRRMTEEELVSWNTNQNNHFWTFRVSDKFGDSGLTGIISLQQQGTKGKIIDFILSCRVFGRKVEETMLHKLIQEAKGLGIEELEAEYLQTEKNNPTLKFLDKSGLTKSNNIYKWNTNNHYPLPDCITINKL